MENLERVYSSEQIYDAVWGGSGFNVGKTISVHIRNLRKKIEIDPSNPDYLKVVHGFGYKVVKLK
jgi:DNA-binding response OmpR family regulator